MSGSSVLLTWRRSRCNFRLLLPPPGPLPPASWGGYRFGKILRNQDDPPGFSEQTLILIWGAVLLSVPKNTLISRAPRAQGVSGWGRGGPPAGEFLWALRGFWEFHQILVIFL